MIAYQVIWTKLFFFQVMVCYAKCTGFIVFLPGVAVKTKNLAECISKKMKIAKFRPEHVRMMHVMYIFFHLLERDLGLVNGPCHPLFD